MEVFFSLSYINTKSHQQNKPQVFFAMNYIFFKGVNYESCLLTMEHYKLQ